MTIKLELPQNDPLVLQEMGLALTRIAAALQDGKTTATIETTVSAGDLSHTVKETVEPVEIKGTVEETVTPPPTVTETFTESGPFYWVEKASCTLGSSRCKALATAMARVRWPRPWEVMAK